jgi:hypothetical protein
MAEIFRMRGELIDSRACQAEACEGTGSGARLFPAVARDRSTARSTAGRARFQDVLRRLNYPR